MSYLKSANKLTGPCILIFSAVMLSSCSKDHKGPLAEVSNNPPEVGSQVFTTQTDVVIREQLRARDPEELPLTFTVIQPPLLGQLSLSRDGRFSYTPAQEITGSDRFIFSVSDGVNPGVTATAEVTIVVLKVNFTRFGRQAFSQQLDDKPLNVNGRVFTQTNDVSDNYADLLLY